MSYIGQASLPPANVTDELKDFSDAGNPQSFCSKFCNSTIKVPLVELATGHFFAPHHHPPPLPLPPSDAFIPHFRTPKQLHACEFKTEYNMTNSFIEAEEVSPLMVYPTSAFAGLLD
jgi:hypothetical protein